MKRYIKKILKIQNIPRQIIILNQLGQLRSKMEKESIDSNGSPIPWFTYPSIEYLNQLDLSELNILEWGSGNSTLYFSKRCKSITTIEHDLSWKKKVESKIKKMGSDNVEIIHVPLDDYLSVVAKKERNYDIVIVDGKRRCECLFKAHELLNDNGFIILDNSDRYPECCEKMRRKDYIQIDFHGFGPIVTFTTTTSFFLKRNVILKPKHRQPQLPTGGGF